MTDHSCKWESLRSDGFAGPETYSSAACAAIKMAQRSADVLLRDPITKKADAPTCPGCIDLYFGRTDVTSSFGLNSCTLNITSPAGSWSGCRGTINFSFGYGRKISRQKSQREQPHKLWGQLRPFFFHLQLSVHPSPPIEVRCQSAIIVQSSFMMVGGAMGSCVSPCR